MIWRLLNWLATRLEDWSHCLHRLAYRWESRKFPPAPSPTMQAIIETTIRAHAPTIAANIANNNPLYKHLTRKGK